MFPLTSMRPGLVHSVVDALFEGKKALMKAQVNTFLDGLFDQLKSEVKEMLVPVQDEPIDNEVSPAATTISRTQVPLTSESTYSSKQDPMVRPKQSTSHLTSIKREQDPNSPQTHEMVFAVKSKPSTSKHSPTGSAKHLIESSLKTKEDSIHQDENESSVLKKLKTAHDSYPEVMPTRSIDKDNEQTSDHQDEPGDNFEHQEQPKSTKAKPRKSNGSYICSYPNCNKSFGRAFILKRHQRIHQGLKPYRCKWTDCSYSSEERSHTIRHIQQTHLKYDSKKKLSEDQVQNPDRNQEDGKVYLEVVHDLLR